MKPILSESVSISGAYLARFEETISFHIVDADFDTIEYWGSDILGCHEPDLV